MELSFDCYKCGKQIKFESEKATRVFEEGTEGAIYKVFCVYCGAENNTVFDRPVTERTPT